MQRILSRFNSGAHHFMAIAVDFTFLTHFRVEKINYLIYSKNVTEYHKIDLVTAHLINNDRT